MLPVPATREGSAGRNHRRHLSLLFMHEDEKHGGWIKLHTKILNWEWYGDANTFRVFLHLLLTANFKPKRWKGIEVGRGQLIIGRKQLAEDCGISEKNVRTALEHLKATNELAIKPFSFCSLVTIKNYEKYQQTGQQSGQQPANNRPPLQKGRIEEGLQAKLSTTVHNPSEATELIKQAKGFTSDDERWPDVLDRLKAMGYYARIDGDVAIFAEGEWKVKGGQGWVKSNSSIREKLCFVKR